MKILKFKLPIFDINLKYILLEENDSHNDIESHLIEFGLDSADKDAIHDNILNEIVNGGNTFRNFQYREMLILIYPTTSLPNTLLVLGHENRHVVDRICEFLYINDIETPAYIAGYINKKMIKLLE